MVILNIFVIISCNKIHFDKKFCNKVLNFDDKKNV